MSKRTQIADYSKIEKPEDLNEVVKDKRREKRANKKKAKRRNRHYANTLLRHFVQNYED
jgi:phage protein D